MLASIDGGALLQLAWAAPLAVIVVALTFALCIHGAARATDSRRAGRAFAASAYIALAVLAGTAFGATVVFGVLIITNKG